MPDLRSLTPVATSTVNGISLEPRKREDNYALQFTGYIDIPENGIYTFSVTSDDGAVLKIAGAPVVDDETSHAPRTVSGKIQLMKGRYPISCGYYQIGGAARLNVKVAGPGMGSEEIPAAWLGH